jgi:hypothetical protein
MFRFTRKPPSGSHSQYLVKITHLVQCRYIELVQDVVSVVAVHCVSVYTLTQCTAHTHHRP